MQVIVLLPSEQTAFQGFPGIRSSVSRATGEGRRGPGGVMTRIRSLGTSKCVQTPRLPGGANPRPPADGAAVAAATVKVQPARGGRPTFEAFLVHDDGVVLRSLRQAEELASEDRKEGIQLNSKWAVAFF